MIVLARLLVHLSARLVPAGHRDRWREEWLGELDAAAHRSRAAAMRFAAGAPRDAWSTRAPRRLLSAIGTDCIYAGRQVLRRPGYTVAVIACLAVGLVASIATLSLITSIIYGDSPGVADRRSIVRIYLGYDTAAGFETLGNGKRVTAEPLSLSDFAVLRDLATTPALDTVGAEGILVMTAAGNHGPLSITGAFASGDFFRTLRTAPTLGRLITPDDDRPDAPPVAVVGDHFWRTHLDARADAIGQPILLGGVSFTVIGVAPPRFHGMQLLNEGEDDAHGVQAWVPLAHARTWPRHPPLAEPWLMTVARIAAGHTLEEAQLQLSVVARRIAAADPASRANASPLLRSQGIGPNSGAKFAALVAALLALPLTVLAIGCANVANLQLARAADRSRELAVRLALGATRAQLVRLLTIETMARVTVAAGVSIALAHALLVRLEHFFPIYLSLDWRALVFAIALVVVVALATGLAPSWLVLRRTAAGQLKQTAQSGGLGHARLRAALVVTQVALSLALLALTGLFARTVQTMISDVPPALREQLVASFDPSELRMSPVESRQFAETLAARVAGDARVSGVALSTESRVRFGVPGEPNTDDRFASLVATTPSWLDVMQVRVLTGRRLTAADDTSDVMISQRAAELIAPGSSPLGVTIRIEAPDIGERRLRVAGVVADNPTRPTVERPEPVLYVPFPSELREGFTLRIRSASPESVRADLMTLVNQVDPRIAWTSIRRGDMAFQDDANEMTYGIWAAGVAGLVALILSATGLYAVMSYVMMLRRREIGVRVAIGASSRQIAGLMLRQAMKLIGIGVACGLALALPMSYVMRATFVARVTAFDPLVFAPTVAVLLVVGAIASIVPALRAARVDPLTTLRED